MTIRTLEPTPVVTVGPAGSSFGLHNVSAPNYNFEGMPFIYEHPIPWSMVAKYFEPVLQEATQKVISMLLENQKTLEDFIDSALVKVNGGKIYGDLDVAGDVNLQGQVTVVADAIFQSSGSTPYPVSLVPVGTIIPYAGDTVPDGGWVVCNGQELKITDYPYLSTVCGTRYNTPAPTAGYFRVPNLKGRVIVGVDPGDTDFDIVGETGGAKTVTLTAAQSGLPSHSHSITDVTHNHTVTGVNDVPAFNLNDGNIGVLDSGYGNVYTKNTSSAYTGITGTQSVSAANASQSHTNVQPYQVLNYIIKY